MKKASRSLPSRLTFLTAFAAVSLSSARAQTLADSEAEFARGEGVDGWTYGYVIVPSDTPPGSAEEPRVIHYDAETDFIPFDEEDDWLWNGSRWDFGDANEDGANDNPPWTTITAVGGHPNGTNQAEEHLAIRRWTAEVTEPTAIAVMMHLHKDNVGCGNGAAISLHHNGQQVFIERVAFDDAVGIDELQFLEVEPGDHLDLALSSEGPDGGTEDGCDGSTFGMVIVPDDPLLADSDGDGESDGEELLFGTDPNDANSNYASLVDEVLAGEIIGDSVAQFSGTQGENNWFNGRRLFTQDGGSPNYDPQTQFIPYPDDWWNGTAWDFPGGNVPWTSQGPEATHPNGTNSGGQEEWAIRRWAADIEELTPVAVVAHIRKTNPAGTGVSGVLHINGVQVYKSTLAGGDDTGTTKIIYANLFPGDVVDWGITPEGPNNDRSDGADGSATTMVISKTILDPAVQPDGTPFMPTLPGDSDGDGLDDSLERLYFPDDLTALTADGDYDEDGLTDLEELTITRTPPNNPDADDDGLLDGVETGTGIFVSADDTGTSPLLADTDGDGIGDGDEVNGDPATDPNKADTDGDGFSDSVEIAQGFDPNDPDSNPFETLLANSVTEFSGVQGQDNWFNGYRDLGAFPDEEPGDYDPEADFVAYPEDWWTGTTWDEPNADTDNVPWTTQGPEDGHPNGTNSTDGSADPSNYEQWAIRRWVANDLTVVTPLALSFSLRKTNPAGGGTTAQLHLNGMLVDSITVAGADLEGETHVYYANVAPGDSIDVALTPENVDGSRADGSDGSAFSLRVDSFIPENPMQPDGTPFEPFIPGDPHLSLPFRSPFGDLAGTEGPQTRMIELKNAGATQTLTVSAGAITGPQADHYTLDAAFPIELAPDESANLSVTFDPTGLDGGFAAQLELTSNDSNETTKSVDLSASIPDPNQLLGWYKLDDAAGGQLFDSSGNSNHGAYVVNGDASIDYEAAALAGGTAIGLEQATGSAYAQVTGFPATESLTVSMWVAVPADATEVTGLLSKSQGNVGDPYALAISGGSLIWFGAGNQDITSETPLITDTETHHLAVTYAPAAEFATVTFYLDGEEVLTSEEATVFTDSSATLVIGAVVSEATFGFDGVIDDVQIYGKTLTATEVGELYANPGSKLGGGDGPQPAVDTDRDGVSDADEALAGTDPNDRNSVLRITEIQRLDVGNTVIWPSVAGKQYRVWFTEDLTPDRWVDLGTVDATGPSVEYLHAGSEGFPAGFYRLEVGP